LTATMWLRVVVAPPHSSIYAAFSGHSHIEYHFSMSSRTPLRHYVALSPSRGRKRRYGICLP
jgi:hypothetical protein